jgi:hypothetical protein
MGHKCYISFKTEDQWAKEEIQNRLDIDMVDKSLNEPINSNNFDYIMRVIREDYLSDSTVTIFLIGRYSSENRGQFEQRYIKRELQASLYNREGNTRSGILGIVLPEMTDTIYLGQEKCAYCGNMHNLVQINDSTVIKEFSYNYYLPTEKCAWAEEDRYCVLVKWEAFKSNPEKYINQAYEKRFSEIANKVKVRP